MTETPADLSTPDEKARLQAAGGYLPRLPDGWSYRVVLQPPAYLGIGQEISVQTEGFLGDDVAWSATVRSNSRPGGVKSVRADDLAGAAKLAVSAARSLTKIQLREKELEAERANVLNIFGKGDEADDNSPTAAEAAT